MEGVIVWLLRRLSGRRDETAEIGVWLAFGQIRRLLLGKYAGLFWAVGAHWEGPVFRIVWVGFWSLVQDIPEAEQRGGRLKLLKAWRLGVNLD